MQKIINPAHFVSLTMRKLVTLIAMVCLGTLGRAQNYIPLNHRIDSLIEAGLPKSALAEVDKLDLLARKNHNPAEQVHAAIHRMILQSYIQENALVGIIDTLKSQISHATYPVKPVLQSLLGSMYYNYYQQNRWQYSQRSRLEKPTADFTKWDLQTTLTAVDQQFRASLQDAAKEQTTPIDLFNPILKGDAANRYLRPTLYDLLLQRALDFYLSDEAAITKPKLAFSINDARFFGDSRTFATSTINTTDTASTHYRGLKFLQQATLFHLQKQDTEAVADLDIKRLNFLYNKTSLTDKDALYINGLNQVAAIFAKKPIATDALVSIGRYYQNKDSLVLAMQYYQQAVALFPNSLGGINAAVLIKQLQHKNFSTTVEDVNIPGIPVLGLINYQNVTAVKYSVYKLSQNQKNQYNNAVQQYNNYGRAQETQWITAFIKSNKPVQQKELDLPDLHDYRLHHTEFKIDPLPKGNYLVWMEEARNPDTILNCFTLLQASQIAYTLRSNPDDKVEIRVMDRQNGQPIKSASIEITGRDSKNASVFETGITDSNGGFITPNVINGNLSLTAIFNGDTLNTRDRYTYSSRGYNRNNNDDDEERTILFTDRQIYRPGQTIYFKGLQLKKEKGKTVINFADSVKVEFKDPNDKVLNTQTFKPNNFGTFSGTILIPQGILNGEARLTTGDGDVRIRVEEYKRPTFKAEFKAVTESYRLNDSVKVKGSVMAFSGYGLSQARVAYHITRVPVYTRYRPNFNWASKEVKADTIVTDAQGLFEIKFKAAADEGELNNNLVYNYAISMDATDAAGETHSANTEFKVGNNNIAITSQLPTDVLAKDTTSIQIGISNLNNKPQSGTLKVQVYALKNPDHLFKNRLWNIPDVFTMSRENYSTDFPYYAYRDEADSKKWQRLNIVSDTIMVADNVKRSYLKLNALRSQAPGTYQVVINGTNQRGDTISQISYVNLVGTKAKPSIMADWVVPVLNVVKTGSKAEFMVGINEPVNVLMEQYQGAKILNQQWLYLDKGQKSIKIPVAKTDSDVRVQFLMVYQNRVYASYQPIQITQPDNSLDIKMITFRDKLQPGDKEQWKLQVLAPNKEKQAAEMVAGLYDASLDDIAPPVSWRNLLATRQRYNSNYFNWPTYDFVQQLSTRPLVRQNFYYQQAQRQYEELNMLNYNYYGGYNYGYRQYNNGQRAYVNTTQRDKELELMYTENAKKVKDGVDVSGKVVDEQGFQVPGVSIRIGGTAIGITTNSVGAFKIKVPVNGILSFTSLGYEPKTIAITKAQILKITLKGSERSLNEVVVTGYGTQRKASLTGAVTSVRLNGKDVISGGRGVKNLPADIVIAMDTTMYSSGLYGALQGKVPGVQIINGEPGGAVRVMLRGNRSITGDNQALVVVDGVIVSSAVLGSMNPDDIGDINVLNNTQGAAIYGAKAANGVIVITTKAGKAKLMGSQPIVIRKNFNETAFFYPQLRTNAKGEILIEFTIPEALTKWKFKGFAHTQDLKSGYIEQEVVTQKQLSISANTPRFLREGDTLTVSARLANLTAAPLKGKINLQLFNAINMQPVALLLNPADAEQNFEVAASANKAVSFKMAIPPGLDALTYRLTADAGQFTDGEENTLPVLPNHMLVTESMPMMMRPGQTRNYIMDKLVNQSSTTLKNKTLTLEYTQNPAWYAVQSLPYMMEFPYECSEQIFSRYYANSMASGLVNKLPIIKKVFDEWKATNSTQLFSNLEKNQELKATLLEETPWLRDATNETEQKKRIALLFDLTKMTGELQQNLDKLQKRQLPNGGFPWFGGERADGYITRHILAGIGQLYHTGMVDLKNEPLKNIADKAMNYLDNELIAEANKLKYDNTYDSRKLWSTEIHAYYTKSYFTNGTQNAQMEKLLAKYLKLAEQQWLSNSLYEQAMIAITMQRNHKPEVAQKIIRSLLETAQQSDELGMYWGKNQLGYYWYQSPVETQCLMIELFSEAGNQAKAVDEMKIWLLRNKQTTNWKTTKATAAACYALLLKGDDWLADNGTSDIKLDGKNLLDLKPGLKADAGIGYLKTSWADAQIKPAMGKVSVANNGKTISWGAMHWQYLENLDKITPSNTDIHLERHYFILKQTDAGPVLTAIDATHQPKTGDVLKVVVYLKAGRDYEYVQLKDMRPSGTEPVDALSAYKYQEGLYYYQVTKDVATNFFISNLNKGNYVFEYQLRVAQPGNFATGISTVQCMYAPEFNAHSQGERMVIK